MERPGYGIYVEDGERGCSTTTTSRAPPTRPTTSASAGPVGRRCDHVVATLSAVGYSGTNPTGVVVRDSTWDDNGAGIVPNSYANEALPPQARTTIVRNTITGSGRAPVPIRTALAGFVGIGVGWPGGTTT